MKNNKWVEQPTKPKTNIYIYDYDKTRCIILDGEEGRLATTVEFFIIGTGNLHYYFFHLPTRKFIGHIQTPGSLENGILDNDLSLLSEYKEDLFSLDYKFIIPIFPIRTIIEEYS